MTFSYFKFFFLNQSFLRSSIHIPSVFSDNKDVLIDVEHSAATAWTIYFDVKVVEV